MVKLLTACCLAHRVPQGIPTHRVVVPTVGTLRTRYVAGALMNAGAHVLLIGPAGAVSGFQLALGYVSALYG